MADVELDVESGETCSGNLGTYMGNLYHTVGSRKKLTLTRTKLGGFNAALNDPITMIQRARLAAEQERGYEIPPERIAALGLLRLCFRRRHVDAELAVGLVPSVERVASLAVAHSFDDIEPIRPLKGDTFDVNAERIGSARRFDQAMSVIQDALIHLPPSPAEARTYRVHTAVRTSAAVRSISEQPYVALHGENDQHLEHIVLLDELR